jgi:hypothetical protein
VARISGGKRKGTRWKHKGKKDFEKARHRWVCHIESDLKLVKSLWTGVF